MELVYIRKIEMKKIIVFSIGVVSFLLTACGEKVYTVDEFKASEGLRVEYTKKCSNGELKGKELQNCDNLFSAQMSLSKPTRNPNAWD